MMRNSLLEVYPVISQYQFVFPEAPARQTSRRNKSVLLTLENISLMRHQRA